MAHGHSCASSSSLASAGTSFRTPSSTTALAPARPAMGSSAPSSRSSAWPGGTWTPSSGGSRRSQCWPTACAWCSGRSCSGTPWATSATSGASSPARLWASSWRPTPRGSAGRSAAPASRSRRRSSPPRSSSSARRGWTGSSARLNGSSTAAEPVARVDECTGPWLRPHGCKRLPRLQFPIFKQLCQQVHRLNRPEVMCRAPFRTLLPSRGSRLP
mmetsp:Transcript_44359/g.137653  ORF Transcript_44359/g.137653 Transcript_44359/m.137653 type:complete len:215 (-) Transcript_44359:1-645(-)